MSGLDLQSASVGPHAISGDLIASITWSDGSITLGRAEHDHMIGLLLRARREGIDVRRDGDAGPALVDLYSDFPYPAIAAAYARGDRTWFEIAEDRHNDARDALPPIYFRGGFFMGEPFLHVPRGPREIAVHAAYVERGGRYFVRMVPIHQADAESALSDLTTALVEES